jgi:hypothetical protein
MPKFGDAEVSEETMLDYFRSRGKRVVTEEDYEKKASAANDLAKLRNLSGDNRSMDELAGVIKGQKDLEGKVAEKDAALAKLTKEVKINHVNTYVKAATGALGVKIADQFLSPLLNELYDIDPAVVGKETYDAKVKEVVAKANEVQIKTLTELGFAPGSGPVTPSFGSGGRVPEGDTGNAMNDMAKLLQNTAASNKGPAIGPIVPDWMRQAKQ